ncbi:MAG: hypothetical protein CMG66_04115 [Candidatus Marinimicrobia bacterium]|nr:hypothetical protein [Candidatus Neomarinimicrobiota bacterium]
MHTKIIYIILILLLNCDNNSSNYICDHIEYSPELMNFSLQDKNPNSNTYRECIGPDYFPNTVRLFYFSNNPN